MNEPPKEPLKPDDELHKEPPKLDDEPDDELHKEPPKPDDEPDDENDRDAVRLRKEYFSKKGLITSMNRSATRRLLSEEYGSLLSAVELILLRAVQEDGDLHYVTVVSYRNFKHGRRQRRYTGVAGLLRSTPELPFEFESLPDDVQSFLSHELQADVPLSSMGTRLSSA